MDNQNLYQRGIDSGDENCLLSDFFPENLPMVGTGMQNVRGQTTVQSVSLANCSRDVGPSQSQYSNKAVPGNEQMFFPDHPAANAYAHELAGSFNQQHSQYPPYHPSGPCNPALGIDFYHGLPPSAEAYSNMPGFAEPFEFTHVSPATLNSSFSSSAGSSIASERMASMTLDSAPPQDHMPPMDFPSSHHASSTGIRGQNWVGNCPATISPKMLRINPSPTPTSSSESIQGGVSVPGADSDLGASAWDHHEARNITPPRRSTHKARKELPTKPAKSRATSSSSSSSLPHEPVTLKGKSKVHARQHVHQSPSRCLAEPVSPRPIPKNHFVVDIDGAVDAMPSGSADPERDAKNRFLVESKLAGMTYREIRRQGGFTEAESTLRGRFRTLTKNKEARVRKPEWQDKDVSSPMN